MLKNKKGYSLVVLIIAIAVILIITTTAIMSITGVGKDRDISSFMNDLADLKQYVIEYMAKNNTLPVKMSDGNMMNAEEILLQTLSGDHALSQLNEEDVGTYYYIDIAKLGKIHLVDDDRGYIVNEGTLNVYTTKPCVYEGKKYYTLTPYLLNRDIVQSGSTPFEIVVMGNPITWSNKAEILVSVPNVVVGEAEGWNFKWLKGSKTATDFTTESKVNYFTYGDVITLTENGVYSIYVENPEGKANVRKVIVSKIDDIAPTIKMVSGELVIDDAETGISNIRCKIKETTYYDIDDETRNKYPEYYTMADESFSDTSADALRKYLWDDRNIKGVTIQNYLTDYQKYYEEISVYNEVVTDTEATSGEIENALIAIKNINESYPQFSYNNRGFTNSVKNLVVYVEDGCGNAAVYSAISRDELAAWQYVSESAGNTLLDSKITINGNAIYTNDRNLNIYLQSMHAKYHFVTEEIVDTADWSDFEDNIQFEIPSGDGVRVIYAFFKDAKGKIANAYDKVFLDQTPPSTDAPSVTSGDTGLSIVCNQTDTLIVDDKETQSGLTGSVEYGVKESGSDTYTWYSKVSRIPNLEVGKTYDFVTKVSDKAGNVQISESVSFMMEGSTESGENT